MRRALHERPIAVGLAPGAVGSGAYGRNPTLGGIYGVCTGLTCTGFLLALRQGSKDLRRFAGPLCDATLAGFVVSTTLGLAIGDLDFTPPLHSLAWLAALALGSQVFGWLVISFSLPRLPAALGSVLL